MLLVCFFTFSIKEYSSLRSFVPVGAKPLFIGRAKGSEFSLANSFGPINLN